MSIVYICCITHWLLPGQTPCTAVALESGLNGILSVILSVFTRSLCPLGPLPPQWAAQLPWWCFQAQSRPGHPSWILGPHLHQWQTQRRRLWIRCRTPDLSSEAQGYEHQSWGYRWERTRSPKAVRREAGWLARAGIKEAESVLKVTAGSSKDHRTVVIQSYISPWNICLSKVFWGTITMSTTEYYFLLMFFRKKSMKLCFISNVCLWYASWSITAGHNVAGLLLVFSGEHSHPKCEIYKSSAETVSWLID